jgi:hypothetical protein
MKLKYLSRATIDSRLRWAFPCGELFQGNTNVAPPPDDLVTFSLVRLRGLTGRVRMKSKLMVREKMNIRSVSNFSAFLFAFWLFGVLNKMSRKENTTGAFF